MRRLPGLLLWLAATVPCPAQSPARPSVELPYEGGVITLTADQIIKNPAEDWVGEGNVIATYQDSVLRADRVVYDPATEQVILEGSVEITRGLQWLRARRAEIDVATNTGVLYDAEGFTDEELFLKAERLRKTGPSTYEAEDGFLTACEEAVPKWSFSISRAEIESGGNAHIRHTVFRIKKIPVFYFPYLILPTAEKERSSGLLLPTTGNSNNKGRRISQSFYLVLGRSADLMLHEDYFSKRGLGHGMNFRFRPNQVSYLELDGYLIDDRRNQGGASLNGIGETRFGQNIRAVADFNLVSNFTFRQVFSENFFTATQPTENSRFFLTSTRGSRSFNALISRQETVFPRKNVVTRSTPLLQFKLSGHRLFEAPFYFDLDTSAGGISRSDLLIQTPGVTRRIDFFPRLYLSLPLVQGLRLTPRLGLRGTYYSDSLREGADGTRELAEEGITRRYVDFSLDLQGWGLSKIYSNGGEAEWKHLMEPALRYRYISGIDEFERIIRFDELDAIADAHLVELAIFNRFFIRRAGGQGVHEWLSVKIGQQYFLDPSFGGALETGEVNQFYPLNTLTGFPYATLERNFSPLSTVVRLTPPGRYSFDVRGDYDAHENRFRTFSVTGFLERDLLSLATTYFLTNAGEDGIPESNQIQGRVGLGDFERGLSASTMFSYDAASKRLLNYLGRFNYFWDCCGVSLEFQGFDVNIRAERQIRFSFFLKGIGNFGTIKRPESRF